jgi:hypothetical protein
MRTSKPTSEIRHDGGNGQRVPRRGAVSVNHNQALVSAPKGDGNVTRRKGRRVSRSESGLIAVAATAALVAAPAVPAVLGGRYLNHNETVLKAPARRPRRGRAITGGGAVAAETGALAIAPVVPAILGGANLGNHNETLLASPVNPRRLRQVAAAVVGAETLGANTVALGIRTSPGSRADGTESDGGVLELAVPGDDKSSNRGGPT